MRIFKTKYDGHQQRVAHMLRGHQINWKTRDGVLTVTCSCGKDFTQGALDEIVRKQQDEKRQK